MAPFLRDEGPPVSQQTIQRARESLPLEYGFQTVNETGREVLLVRVPKAKPDYLHDLADVAFYIGLDSIRNTRDILLVGHEKTARLEPQLLRDHIRAQQREDEGVVVELRRRLSNAYGHTVVQSPSNHQHQALALRIPKGTVASFSPEDVLAFREFMATQKGAAEKCQYAYIVADTDFERLGRRVLLELLGIGTAPVPPAVVDVSGSAPTPVAAPAAQAPAAAPQALTARFAFPATPGTAASPPPAAPVAAPASIFAPRPVASAHVAAATPAPVTVVAAPVAPAQPVAAPLEVEDHEEYQIVSKPKAAPPPIVDAVDAPAEAAPAQENAAAAREVHEEYEIVSKPRAVEAAPEPAHAPRAADPDKKVHHATEEYEVFSSKPKPRPEGPAITPPGQGGFQKAFMPQAAPARTKEYEIMGRTTVNSEPSIASRLKLPSATPAPAATLGHGMLQHAPTPPPAPLAQPAPAPVAAAPAHASVRDDPRILPTRAAPPMPQADSGAAIIATLAPANPEGILAARFREAGYDLVEGLRAQGTVFAFAAHKPNGRRVLVKRAADFGPDDAVALAQLVQALGADVGLVVADRVLPGTRLATWGTRIEVCASTDVPTLGF